MSDKVRSRASIAGFAQRRSGIALFWPLAALIVVSASGGGIYYWTTSHGGGSRTESAALLHRVSVGEFTYVVTERGDLESSSNEDIRCLVKSKGGTGTPILKIVPAGTYVKHKEFLIQFDDSSLQADLIQQRIAVANAAALRTQAVSTLETAKATLAEYVDGTSKQELELVRSEVFVAQENLRRSEEHFHFSERLATKDYITAVQLDADRFAVKKSAKELEAAQMKLDVLQHHTYKKMSAQYKGDIDKAEAQLTAAVRSHNLEQQKLKEIEDQIAKCRVEAPSDGQVIYATQSDRSRDEQVVIEEGSMIREGQTVIRLPDPKRMQVRAVINETRINLIKPGIPAKVELDAEPGTELEAVVGMVDAFPIPKRWGGSVKEYGAVVKILEPSDKLRPGLRAKVRIFISGEQNVMQVPVQAVVERRGGHFCVMKDGDEWQAKAVELGPNNDKFVVVRSGLDAGADVALDPRRLLDQVTLPPPVSDSPQLAGAGSRNDRARGRHGRTGEPAPRKADARADSGG
jgi:multidrug resistance efflux pump